MQAEFSSIVMFRPRSAPGGTGGSSRRGSACGASTGASGGAGALDLQVGEPVEPARQVPVAFAEQAHGGRDEQQAHEGRVERERDGDAEPHLLEGDELAGGEAGEDDDDDRRGAGDQARGGRDAVDDARPGCRRLGVQRSWMRLSRNTW